MLRAKKHIRKRVIPDIQVKILALCLGEDENGILMPIIKRQSNGMDFRADWALQEVISTKIDNQKKSIPLALRKKQMYENAIKNNKELDFFEKIRSIKILPITLRKYLLYKDCRAG